MLESVLAFFFVPFMEECDDNGRIIATPGRLAHHMVEAGISLRAVEFVVFDEADRYTHAHTHTAKRM
jgi:ERCC4-related helicase